MNVNGVTIWGVQGEANHAKWGKDSAYTAFATFVDTYSINFYLDKTSKDKNYFTDDNDGKGPSQTIANSRAAYNARLSKLNLTEAQVKTFFANLTAALSQKVSCYNTSAVISLLRSKGLSMDIIAEVLKESPNATGDELIALVLKKAGATDAEIEGCLTDAAKAEKELETLIDSSDPKKIQDALDKLQKANGYDAALYKDTVDKANSKVEESKKKATEAKAKTDAQTAIYGAAAWEKLLSAYTAHRAVIDSDQELKDAAGNKARELLPNAPLTEADYQKYESLIKLVKLEDGEKLVRFIDTNDKQTYYVVVKQVKDKAGKISWDFVTTVATEKEYYIVGKKDGNVELPIIKSEKGYPDPTFQTEVIDPQSGKSTPVGLSEKDRKAWEFFQHLTENNNYELFIKIWADRRIERRELEANRLTVRNAHFNIIDRNMDADAVVDVDSEGVIIEDEIGDYDAQIEYYADERLKARKDLSREQRIELAKTLYKKSIRYRNSDRLAAGEAEGAIGREVVGVTAAQDPKAFLKTLGYSENVAELVFGYITRLRQLSIPVSDNDVAAFMVMTAEASRFDENLRGEVFDLPSETEFDTAFRPKTVTKEKYITWLKGEDVNGEEEEHEGHGKKSEEARIYSSETKRQGAPYQRSLAQAYMKKLLDEGDIEKLEKFYQRAIKSGAKFIDGLEHDVEVIKILFMAYTTSQKDPVLYTKAATLTEKVQTPDTRAKFLFDLAEKYKGLRMDDRAKALDIVNNIIKLVGSDWGTGLKQGEQELKIQQYKQMLETELKVPLDIVKIKDSAMPGGVVNYTEAQQQITNLEKSFTKENDPIKKAYIQMTLAEIYTALASSSQTSDPKKKLELYYKAQKTFRGAYDQFISLSEAKDQTSDSQRTSASTASRILTKMAYEIVNSAKGLKDTKDIEIQDKSGKSVKKAAKDAILAMIDLIPDTSIPANNGGTIAKSVFKLQVKQELNAHGGGEGDRIKVKM